MKPDVVYVRPDSVVPESENAPTIGQAARRIVLLDRASRALGGAAALGEVLGISRRAVTYKLGADRRLKPSEILDVATAIEGRAALLAKLAADMRAVANG